MKNRIFNFSILAILLSLFVSCSDANAQTSRRKKKKTSQTTAIPVPAPEVVGNNQPYIDGNQIILGETPQLPPTTNDSTPVPPPPGEINIEVDARIKELNERIRSLESNSKSEYDQKQKRLALNLDILTKAESRAESLRKQLFEMVEKEASVQNRLEQISFDARPEMIERSTAFSGSLRPEEIREQRRKSFDAEKRNLETLLIQIQSSRASLEENVQKADYLVEKVRLKLDKEIDAALAEDKETP